MLVELLTKGIIVKMQECSNLSDKDRGRMLIDFIEIKSID